MRRTLLAALLATLAAATLPAASPLYVLELKGGARVFALDHPMLQGRIIVFHRNPDGIYSSIPADEVVRIAVSSSADRTQKFQPGDTMVMRGDIDGTPARAVGPPPQPPPPYAEYSPPDYGYGMDWGYYGGGGSPPPHRPPPQRPVPTNIGPNGYPILAPPGSPGSVPPPIGPNGYPVLFPTPPPRPQPR